MKATAVDVEWNDRYDNEPRLKLLVDELPPMSSLIYKSKDIGGSTLFYAELDGYVSFMVHSPRDECGFGGRTFHLHLEDGTQVAIKGPWSSRSGVVNQHFGPCLEVSITAESEVWEQGFTFYSAAVTLAFARAAVRRLRPTIFLHKERIFHDAEVYYVPRLLNPYCPKCQLKVSKRTCPQCKGSMVY